MVDQTFEYKSRTLNFDDALLQHRHKGLPKTCKRVGINQKSSAMLAFEEVTINFSASSGAKSRKQETATFNRKVRVAQAMLKGFNIRYANGDHELLEQEIDLDIKIVRDNNVEVYADFLLRDGSGNIDDKFKGWVQAIVVADLED